MKCVFFALFLINTFQTILPMQAVTLPPKKIIYERFLNLGWQHFLKTTKIHVDLDFQHQYPDQVVHHIELAIKKYNEKYAKQYPRKYKNYSTKPLTKKDQSAMIMALFMHHPEALTYLKNNGYLP